MLLTKSKLITDECLRRRCYVDLTKISMNDKVKKENENTDGELENYFVPEFEDNSDVPDVPVLLDIHLVECVEAIIKHRKNVGVPSNNTYVFGIPGYKTKDFKYLRACNLLRKFSVDCGAEYPERLRGTQLRKHIATTCITLNLEEQQVSDLANFMGHAEKIHKDIYRQPVISRDILNMSRLLEKTQGVDNDSDADVEANESEIFTNNIGSKNDKDKSSKKRLSKFPSPYPKITRKRWSDKEKEIIRTHFRDSIIHYLQWTKYNQ